MESGSQPNNWRKGSPSQTCIFIMYGGLLSMSLDCFTMCTKRSLLMWRLPQTTIIVLPCFPLKQCYSPISTRYSTNTLSCTGYPHLMLITDASISTPPPPPLPPSLSLLFSILYTMHFFYVHGIIMQIRGIILHINLYGRNKFALLSDMARQTIKRISLVFWCF